MEGQSINLDAYRLSKLQIQNTTDNIKIELSKFEYQYAQSLSHILEDGIWCNNRTGINTLTVQHQYFHIKNVADNFPILRGKKVFPKLALKELIWMFMGRNDVKWLNQQKVTYWNEWEIKDVEQAEKLNLNIEWVGTIGKSYGYQYRNFNGYDQLSAVLKEMQTNPTSRRHIINLWNSSELNQMALPPCMYDFHFECTPTNTMAKSYNKPEKCVDAYFVDLHAHVRSNDSFLGAPYDFMFCAWMLTLVCNYLNQKSDCQNFIVNDIHYTADNYHLYENHIEQAKQYLQNVKENSHNVINIPSMINHCFLGDFFDKNYPLTIDTYLQVILNNLSKINIIWNKPEDGFEYDKIQAPVAI